MNAALSNLGFRCCPQLFLSSNKKRPNKLIILRLLSRFSIVICAILWSSLAFAVTIEVDPDSYTGTWRIQGQTPEFIGPESIEIAAGHYNVVVGTVGGFSIDVEVGGMVTSNNLVAATGGNNAISFNTAIVHIDPADFIVQNFGLNNARWGVSRVVKDNFAAADVVLVKGVNFHVIVGTFGGFVITLDQNGSIFVDDIVHATVSGNTLTFNTIEIFIDPGEFLNQVHGDNNARWGLSRVIKDATTAATINVMPGTRYSVDVGSYGQMFIHIDATGIITVENGFSGNGGYRTLQFNTTKITVDPGDFIDQVDGGSTAFWHVSRVNFDAQGAGDLIVVPGITYGAYVGSFGVFLFQVAENGDISVVNGYSGSGVANTLLFNTETVLVDPGSYLGNWSIGRALGYVSGQQTVNLVPGVRYGLFAGDELMLFDVANPCAVNPSSHQFAVGTFSFSCGLLDSDEDGVPDVSDNCPLDVNSDQVDLDDDGSGDVCDDDLDGDGVNNAADNCPAFSNSGQEDLDGDSLGDVCDGDVDGDSVVDVEDNCRLIPNSGQGDSDMDGIGDSCDIDDDNDGIVDEGDNCPFHYNPQQSDLDGNGQGDVCDGDIDGDGVSNEEDDCAASPVDQPITSNGCSGSQYVALQCVKESFVQHGKYVSCVAHTAMDLVSLGIIDNKDKSILVREAAKNK